MQRSVENNNFDKDLVKLAFACKWIVTCLKLSIY